MRLFLQLAGWLALAAALGVVGRGLERRAGRTPLAVGLAGLFVLHALLLALDLLGLPWAAWTVFPLLALWVGVRRREALGGWRRPALPRPDWGDGVAWVVLAILAAIVLLDWATTPDFYYHWGLKGRHFFAWRGIDYELLAAQSRPLHGDYPQLLPGLYATTSMLLGADALVAWLAWSALFFAGLLAGTRRALHRFAPTLAAPGLALVALATGATVLSLQLAGSPDLLLALVLVAALPTLLEPEAEGGELRLGVAAAVAAGAKLEGAALAGLLIVTAALQRWARGRGLTAGAVARLWLPSVVVVAPWYLQLRRHGLSVDTRSGISRLWDLERLAELGQVLPRALLAREWGGVAVVALALLPLLFLHRRLRWPAAVIVLQLLFYLAVYAFTAVRPGFDLHFWVLSSFPRLLFHLVPALLVLALVGLEGIASGSEGADERARRG